MQRTCRRNAVGVHWRCSGSTMEVQWKYGGSGSGRGSGSGSGSQVSAPREPLWRVPSGRRSRHSYLWNTLIPCTFVYLMDFMKLTDLVDILWITWTACLSCLPCISWSSWIPRISRIAWILWEIAARRSTMWRAANWVYLEIFCLRGHVRGYQGYLGRRPFVPHGLL